LVETGDAITTFPVTSVDQKPAIVVRILNMRSTLTLRRIKINAYFAPTLNFHNTETGLQYAISIDDETPQIVSIKQ
jgi:hypothetical protein